MEVHILEWMGWFVFIIVLCYASYPGRVRKLESKVKKLQIKEKGDKSMSKIINELVGKRCKIETEELVINDNFNCTVLECDDEWIKISYTDKKNNVITKILRIDNIDSIELKSE